MADAKISFFSKFDVDSFCINNFLSAEQKVKCLFKMIETFIPDIVSLITPKVDKNRLPFKYLK